MIKNELASKMAKKFKYLDVEKSIDVCDFINKELEDAIYNGERVSFGIIRAKAVIQPGRKNAHNPRTMEKIVLKPYWKTKIYVLKSFRDRMKSKPVYYVE